MLLTLDNGCGSFGLLPWPEFGEGGFQLFAQNRKRFRGSFFRGFVKVNFNGYTTLDLKRFEVTKRMFVLPLIANRDAGYSAH